MGVEPARRQAHPHRVLALIVVLILFTGLAGTAGSITGISDFRAGVGLGERIAVPRSRAGAPDAAHRRDQPASSRPRDMYSRSSRIE
jgi:hypothetical protein